ncbi:hypothetical protein VW040_17230 [Phaeobacter sp. JH85H1]|uniref:hypothetical protein n=1 Tax=unclassified Phaeobacter TaxID=2621772 RepID=UPI003A8A9475
MSDTEFKGVEPSVVDSALIDETIVAKFEDKLSAFEVTVRSGTSNHEVKSRYEFRQRNVAE